MKIRLAISIWLRDLAWAVTMMRVRRMRRALTFEGGALAFHKRSVFDDVLRREIAKNVVAYPDAIYMVTTWDLRRADVAAHWFAVEQNPRALAVDYLQAERDGEVETMVNDGWLP